MRELLFVVQYAVDIHRMPMIVIPAQQQFLPVRLYTGKVLTDIDGGHIDKNRGQLLIGQQLLVEVLNEQPDLLRAVHIGLGR